MKFMKAVQGYLIPLLVQWSRATVMQEVDTSYYRVHKRRPGQRQQVQVWELMDGTRLKVYRARLGLWRLDSEVR